MVAKNAKLYLTPGGVGSSVEVDGQKLTGIRGIDLSANVYEIPSLTLDLVIREVEIEGEAIVSVPDKTRDTLIALGWTPPADDPEA